MESASKKRLSQHSKVLVLGLGQSGYSVVRFLRSKGIEVVIADSRTAPPYLQQVQKLYPDVEVVLGEFDSELVASHSLIIVSPGIDLAKAEFKLAKENGIPFIGDIELFAQHNDKPIIAITGSNGKSTVTTLVGDMSRAAGVKTLVAGNIGKPALDALTDGEDFELAVLELSSFQLETTYSLEAEAATILNVSEDHLDRYESFGDYVLAKARILRGAKRAVLPRHQESLNQITNVSERYTFGLDEPQSDMEFGVVKHNKHRWLVRGSARLMRLEDVPLLGSHNIENALAAFALIGFLEFPLSDLVAAIQKFESLPHRMELVAKINSVSWVNDSKATNVGATITALASLDGELIWIAGGQGKEADFSGLKDALRSNIRLVILMGEDADEIEKAIARKVQTVRVDNMQEAVALAFDKAGRDSTVLLSPACASFDMYQSFAHRGDDFKERVLRLRQS